MDFQKLGIKIIGRAPIFEKKYYNKFGSLKKSQNWSKTSNLEF